MSTAQSDFNDVEHFQEWAKEKMEAKKENVLAYPKFNFENPSFTGDVVNKEGDLIFHFFPTPNDRFHDVDRIPRREAERLCKAEVIWKFRPEFKTHLAAAFLAVFKFQEKLFWDFVPELNSWVVRAAGFGDNPLYATLVERLLLQLKKELGDD